MGCNNCKSTERIIINYFKDQRWNILNIKMESMVKLYGILEVFNLN
jgi:hypothetical protein